MAFGEIYSFAAVFSNRIHKYSLRSWLFEAWPCWKRSNGWFDVPFFASHHYSYQQELPENHIFAAHQRTRLWARLCSKLWIFIKLSEILTWLKGRSLMSIMLINLFLFFGNWTAFKSVDTGYFSQNATSLWPQHFTLFVTVSLQVYSKFSHPSSPFL